MNKEELVEIDLTKNYEKYYRLCYSYLGNEADALDAVQEGAYKAIKNIEKLLNVDYLSTWIYRIMINEATDILRKKGKTLPLLSDENEGKSDSYEDLDLKKAIANLEIKDQTIIKLKYFSDFKLNEIAEVTGLNENTVKTRLYRSLSKLKEILEA